MNCYINHFKPTLATIGAILFILLTSNPVEAAIETKKNLNNPIALRVNNKFFTDQEIEDRYQYSIKLSDLKIFQKNEGDVLLAKVIQKLIEEELIRQQGKKLKIEIDNSEIERSLEFFAKHRKKSVARLKSFFSKKGIDLNSFRLQIEAELIWSRIVDELIRPQVKVSEIEINELLEQRKISDKITRYNLAEIVFEDSNNSLEFSTKMLQELQNGADFEAMVSQFSMASSSRNGGKIGWFSISELNPKISLSIVNLKKNHYSPPILLGDGYHIFKLLDITSESYMSDEELSMVRNFVANQKLDSLSKGYLLDLKKKAFIEISFKKN